MTRATICSDRRGQTITDLSLAEPHSRCKGAHKCGHNVEAASHYALELEKSVDTGMKMSLGVQACGLDTTWQDIPVYSYGDV